ncbi:MAG: hypothetical protein AAF330_00940 [Pseudomonadota bacterium]
MHNTPLTLAENTTYVVGSAPEASRVRDASRPPSTRIIAVNNGWQVHAETDAVLVPGDFPEDRLPPPESKIRVIRTRDYVQAQIALGDVLFCGATMAFSGGYYALMCSAQRMIGLAGCNMVYDGEKTHFYGQGRPDPLIKSPYTYPSIKNLKAKSARLFLLGLMQNALILNATPVEGSQLLCPSFPATPINRAQCERLLTSEAVIGLLPRIADGLALERAFPGDRGTRDLSKVFKNSKQMDYIDRVDAHWQSLGQEAVSQVSELLS